MKKGIDDITFVLVISLIFVFATFVIIIWPLTYTKSSEPEELLKKLGEDINYICENGGEKELYFDIDQDIPSTLLIPTYFRLNDDPDYMIYYERMEFWYGWPWEVFYDSYHDVVFIPFKSTSIHIDNAYDTLNEFKEGMLSNSKEDDSAKIIITNIFSYDDFEKDGELYVYKNKANRTYKYTICMDNALCLKKKKYIYAYKLDKCEKAGVDYILIKSDMTRFAMISPCKGKLKIKKIPCSCDSTPVYVYDKNLDTLQKRGEIKNCTMGGGETCILITFTDQRGFCFPFVSKSAFNELVDKYKDGLIVKKDNYFKLDQYVVKWPISKSLGWV